MFRTRSASVLSAYLQNTVLVVVALLIVNLGVTWLLGWRTPHEYGHGLFFAGLSVIVIGLFSVFGVGRFADGVPYFYSASLALRPGFRPATRSLDESASSLLTMLVLCSAGFLTLLLGVLIESAFPQALSLAP